MLKLKYFSYRPPFIPSAAEIARLNSSHRITLGLDPRVSEVVYLNFHETRGSSPREGNMGATNKPQ